MNERRRRHPRYRPEKLRSREAFRRYSMGHGGQVPAANAPGIAQLIVRKHCAGYHRRLDGKEVLETLREGPVAGDERTEAIMCTLGTVSIAECTKLVVRCGATYEQIARFVREKEQVRDDLVRYLNQFAIGD